MMRQLQQSFPPVHSSSSDSESDYSFNDADVISDVSDVISDEGGIVFHCSVHNVWNKLWNIIPSHCQHVFWPF